MNLPNKLSILRMCLVPVFVIIMVLTVLLSGCNLSDNGAGSDSSPAQSSENESSSTPEPEENIPVNNFEAYQSNSITPSGNNYMIKSKNGKTVTELGSSLFAGCNSFTDIYYTGTEEEWKSIKSGSYNNDVLVSANVHFGYAVE